MINPVLCEYCASPHIRRSRRRSKAELFTMALGNYPFRCLDCNGRFSVNVFLFARLAFAKCPKCLRTQLTTWGARSYRISLSRKLMITFGCRRYRCPACRYNFVSFRPLAAQRRALKLKRNSRPRRPNSGTLTSGK